MGANFYAYYESERTLLFAENFPKSKPCVADIDDDRDIDLFLALGNGRLAFFENIGTETKPQFELRTHNIEFVDFDLSIKPISFGTDASCVFIDYGNDNDKDLLLSNANGDISLYENIGTRTSQIFRKLKDNFVRGNFGKWVTLALEDINFDTLDDLIITNEVGSISYIPNTGDIKFADYGSEPRQLYVFPEKRYKAVTSFIDWDFDGDLDMVVGTEEGQLLYLQNSGDKFNPKFRNIFNFHIIRDVDGFSAPLFVDLNNDNRRDLLVGNITDMFRYYENRSDELLPDPLPDTLGTIPPKARTIWSINKNLLKKKSLVNYGGLASIAVGDADGDGKNDIITGEGDGTLNLFLNQHTNKVPNFWQFSDNLFPNLRIKRPVPEFVDINGDGKLDLLIGTESGGIVYMRNIGSPGSPKWEFVNMRFGNINVGGNSSPRAYDFDKDNLPDLFIGSSSGRIFYFGNNGQTDAPLFVEKPLPYANPLRGTTIVPAFLDARDRGFPGMVTGTDNGELEIMHDPLPEGFEEMFSTGRERFDYSENTEYLPQLIPNFPVNYDFKNISPYTIDFDEDGLTDLFVANGSGGIHYYRNAGYREFQPIPDTKSSVYSNLDPIFERSQLLIDLNTERVYPTFGDVDQDRDYDMVYGTADGSINLIINSGSPQKPKFEKSNIHNLLRLNAQNVSPNFYDLDGDGDLDLLVGKKNGEFNYFENISDSEGIDYVEVVGVFDGVRVNRNSTPTAVKIGNNTSLVVSGDILGKINQLRLFTQPTGINSFEVINRKFGSIDIGIASAPVFEDLNIDGIPEMIIGSDSGAIQVFKNRTGNLDQQAWIRQRNYEPIPRFPPGTFPAVIDIDIDQDSDLIVGSMDGKIYLVTNDAIKN